MYPESRSYDQKGRYFINNDTNYLFGVKLSFKVTIEMLFTNFCRVILYCNFGSKQREIQAIQFNERTTLFIEMVLKSSESYFSQSYIFKLYCVSTPPIVNGF